MVKNPLISEKASANMLNSLQNMHKKTALLSYEK